MLYLIAVVIL